LGETIAGYGTGALPLADDDQPIDSLNPNIGLHSAPIIGNNVIVVGAAHISGATPLSKTNVKGYVRGFDVKTGKRLWIFHTIPKPMEFGFNTWENDSWSYTGNTGSWGQASIDPDLNMVYIGVEMPTGDYYGGHRPGNNLFSESIVALDLRTGQRKWHYQYIQWSPLTLGRDVSTEMYGFHEKAGRCQVYFTELSLLQIKVTNPHTGQTVDG
jgi:quinoprotein glucose dehydrogenase